MNSDIFTRALTAFQNRQWEAAERDFRAFLRSEPAHFGALNLYSVLLLQRGEFCEAATQLRQAISINARSDQTFYNYGLALKGLKMPSEAVEAFTKAIELNPGVAETWTNRGTSFNELKRYQAAIADFDRAIRLAADYAEAHYNKGNSLRLIGDTEGAMAAFQRAAQIRPLFCEAWEEIAFLFGSRGDHPAALAACEKSLDAHPDSRFARALRCLSKANLCDWKQYAQDTAAVIQNLDSDRPDVRLPSIYLTLPASAQQQLSAARSFYQGYVSPSVSSLPTARTSTHDRIRVAYISSDFRDHATAHLIAGVLEQHDHSRFEIVGISTTPEISEPIAQRIKTAMHSFHDVSAKTDAEVATLLQQLGTDIAVDLNGYTQGMRPGILAMRPAPVQINYLGYPGTMGSPHHDYIIGDSTVIPAGDDQFYTEKVVRLPHSYQPNDDNRKIVDDTPSRASVGLPAGGFVFCCFNNSFKITPSIFDVWMRLLGQVEQSVLWLLGTKEIVEQNLRMEAEQRGISPDRLIFSPRTAHADHLSRQRLADLFLDTPHWNAHTTASDALWAGLPVVTLEGHTFASRVASSLLRAIDMPGLITNSIEDYEAMALKLARDPALLADIKEKIANNRDTTALFDTKSYTRHLEAAYETMWERFQSGNSAAAFTVKRN
jgi:predicted O-linked N-acetylglucosamine transferase (SPINDLY family)